MILEILTKNSPQQGGPRGRTGLTEPLLICDLPGRPGDLPGRPGDLPGRPGDLPGQNIAAANTAATLRGETQVLVSG